MFFSGLKSEVAARTVGDNLRGEGGRAAAPRSSSEPSTLGFNWLQVQLGLSAASGLGYSQSQNSHLSPIEGE